MFRKSGVVTANYDGMFGQNAVVSANYDGVLGKSAPSPLMARGVVDPCRVALPLLQGLAGEDGAGLTPRPQGFPGSARKER